MNNAASHYRSEAEREPDFKRPGGAAVEIKSDPHAGLQGGAFALASAVSCVDPGTVKDQQPGSDVASRGPRRRAERHCHAHAQACQHGHS